MNKYAMEGNPMRKSKKPVLVTGSHRSGTTWVGMNLALAPHTGYIHEPFNISKKFSCMENPFRYWYQYICDHNAVKYKNRLDSVMQYQYPLRCNLGKVKTYRNIARVFLDQGRTLAHKLKSDTPIVKDPIAFFSADWLSKTYGMNVLIMIRHPAAFCSSLKIKNWMFDFNDFINQPLLMDAYLGTFEKEIHEFAKQKKNIIDQAVLLWNCIHQTIMIYQKKHPEWIFLRHEDISDDPLGKFKHVFNQFELDFNHKVESAVIKSSGPHNPVEQQPGNEFKRDSKANIYNWKKRLSQEEIEIIREKTDDISKSFYENCEW